MAMRHRFCCDKKHELRLQQPSCPTVFRRTRCLTVQAVLSGLQGGSNTKPKPNGIEVEVEKTSWSSRRLYASIGISAPVQTVWDCLTDYDGLGSFIPSLVENKCLEKRPHGALLRQVGAQDVAMGVKFSAACTLDCTEFMQGAPDSLCTTSGSDGTDGLLPVPRYSMRHVPTRDITFVQLSGDFEAFRGIWRLQPGQIGGTTLLCYALFVQPQAWLPVRLIQDRLEMEVMRNLDAVRKHSEKVYNVNNLLMSSSFD